MNNEVVRERSVENIKNGIIIIKVSFVLMVVLNMFLPMYYPITLGFSFILNWVACIIHFSELLSFIGYGKQKAKLKLIFACRALQFAYFVFVSKKEVFWLCVSILVICDIIYFIILMLDKSRYEYIEEDVDLSKENQ